MMSIVIKDLEFNKELDAKAMQELVGGRRTFHGRIQSMNLKSRNGSGKWMPQHKKR